MLVDDPDLIKQTDDRNAQRKNMQEDENNAIAFNVRTNLSLLIRHQRLLPIGEAERSEMIP